LENLAKILHNAYKYVHNRSSKFLCNLEMAILMAVDYFKWNNPQEC